MPEIRVPEINAVCVSGRLTRDSELRFTQAGAGVLSFDLAVNRRYKAKDGEWKDDVSFVPATSFGKAVEALAERLKKGVPVFIEGRLKSNTWEGKDGKKRTALGILCDRVQVLAKREEGAAPAGDSGDDTDDVPF